MGKLSFSPNGVKFPKIFGKKVNSKLKGSSFEFCNHRVLQFIF